MATVTTSSTATSMPLDTTAFADWQVVINPYVPENVVVYGPTPNVRNSAYTYTARYHHNGEVLSSSMYMSEAMYVDVGMSRANQFARQELERNIHQTLEERYRGQGIHLDRNGMASYTIGSTIQLTNCDPVVIFTAEQSAAFKKQMEEEQEAEKRAMELFESYLSKEQMDLHKGEQYVPLLTADGKRHYHLVTQTTSRNVYLLDKDGKKHKRYCAAPQGFAPKGDVLLGQMMAVIYAEDEFIAKAKEWPLSDAPLSSTLNIANEEQRVVNGTLRFDSGTIEGWRINLDNMTASIRYTADSAQRAGIAIQNLGDVIVTTEDHD